MRIAFFEDTAAGGFAPIALTRPVFELLCGQFSVRERVVRTLHVTEWGAFLRGFLAETYREAQPEARVNDFGWLADQPTLLINGRWLAGAEQLAPLADATEASVGMVGNEVAYILLEPFETALLTDDDFEDPLRKIAATRTAVDAGGTLIKRPWDLIDLNPEMLVADFRSRAADRSAVEFQIESGQQLAILGSPDDVSIDSTASIDPFVVIDARGGPVSIDARVKIQAFTRLEGPCHVGFGSELFRANLKAGSTIGPVCRVGGEIEASIMHGFSNKYHDGFLGHSYVCPWVNMGALTTNSDLKNDYSTVRVPLAGVPVDSGSKKVGAFFGDHTKTALCSQFNTGSSLGVMTMILPGGELLPKHVPSFSRVWHGAIDDLLDLDGALETARRAMERRNCELTAAQERLLRNLYEKTRDERQLAIERIRARQENSQRAGSET